MNRGCELEIRSMAGVSLIELLVAIGLGLIVSFAGLAFYTQLKSRVEAVRVEQNLQTRARILVAHLDNVTRNAGYTGCIQNVNELPETFGEFDIDMRNYLGRVTGSPLAGWLVTSMQSTRRHTNENYLYTATGGDRRIKPYSNNLYSNEFYDDSNGLEFNCEPIRPNGQASDRLVRRYRQAFQSAIYELSANDGQIRFFHSNNPVRGTTDTVVQSLAVGVEEFAIEVGVVNRESGVLEYIAADQFGQVGNYPEAYPIENVRSVKYRFRLEQQVGDDPMGIDVVRVVRINNPWDATVEGDE